MDDTEWRRSLYIAAAFATVAIAVMMVFVIPYVNSHEDINRGPEWAFSGIQLIIVAILGLLAYLNKRDGCFTRIMLVFAGVLSILTGIFIVLTVSDVSGMSTLKRAIWIYAGADVTAGIIALRACIL